MSIANNIRALCRENGISIRNLERTLGLGNGLVASWEKKQPTVPKVKKIADYFGVTVDDLLKEEHE